MLVSRDSLSNAESNRVDSLLAKFAGDLSSTLTDWDIVEIDAPVEFLKETIWSQHPSFTLYLGRNYSVKAKDEQVNNPEFVMFFILNTPDDNYLNNFLTLCAVIVPKNKPELFIETGIMFMPDKLGGTATREDNIAADIWEFKKLNVRNITPSEGMELLVRNALL